MEDNKVLHKLIEHGERLETIEKNLSKGVTLDIFNDRMDKMMTILQRLDQERLFTVEWVKRIEKDVEKIKEHLNIK